MRSRARPKPETIDELMEYLACPDVYHGQPCGDGHTPENIDAYLDSAAVKNRPQVAERPRDEEPE